MTAKLTKISNILNYPFILHINIPLQEYNTQIIHRLAMITCSSGAFCFVTHAVPCAVFHMSTVAPFTNLPNYSPLL